MKKNLNNLASTQQAQYLFVCSSIYEEFSINEAHLPHVEGKTLSWGEGVVLVVPLSIHHISLLEHKTNQVQNHNHQLTCLAMALLSNLL